MLPGCSGFINHCRNSLTMLEQTCQQADNHILCEDLEQVQSDNFIEYLLNTVYASPEPLSPSEECIDTDGDGWGWNGIESCKIEGHIPTAGACIDSDGYGWGWNGIESCIP